MWILSRSVMLEGGDRALPLPASPTSVLLENRHDLMLARYGNLWTRAAQLQAMVHILEKPTVDPWSQTDETRYGIENESVQALVRGAPHAAAVNVVGNGRCLSTCGRAGGQADGA